MVILELAIQGVKGLAPSVRVAFKQGYTLLQPQQPGGSLWRLCEALWYADGRADTSALVAPGAPVARAGLTFQGRDGQTYRLVRELGGQGTLAKHDAASNKFEPITSDAGEIAQYLRSSVGLPTRGAYEQAFAIVASGWPSKQPARPATTGAKMTGSFAALPANAGPRNTGSFQALPPSAGMMPSAARPGVTPASDVNAARATLEALRKELDGTRELDELQYKLDGVQKRIFDLGGQVREADRLRQELAQAQAAVEAAPSPSKLGLPENIAERASKVEVLEKQRDDQLKRLEREREQFLGKSFSVDPLYRDQAFLAAMGVGALTLVLGLALGHAWRYLSLLDIPAFGMGAVLAIRWIGEVQANQSLGRRKAHYDEREKQIQDAFENEVLSVKTAMKLLGVESPGELIDIFAARQVQERQAQEAAQRLAELESNPAVQMAKQQVAEAQAEQSQFEARIGELSSYGRPPHVIEAEIEELEASIQAALAPAAPAPVPTAAPVTAATPAVTAPGTPTPPGEDPVPRLLDATTDLFGADLATLAGLIAPRASQYLAALTERRLSTLEIDAKGQAQVGSAQGKQGAGALPPSDRDLVYLAVKVALMEKYADRARLPYLIDDDFSGFPPGQVALIARVLKHLGTRAQVLHLSASPATEAAADARYAV